MNKQTVVVAIDDISNADNLLQMPFVQTHLVETVEGLIETKVVIHHSPKYRISGTGVDCNFDVMIANINPFSMGSADQLYFPSHRIYKSHRVSKRIQRLIMNRSGAGYPGYMPLRIWTPDLNVGDNFSNSAYFGSGYEGKLVLKADNQARGIGQIVFDTKDYSPGKIYYDSRKVESLESFEEKLPLAALGYDTNNGPHESLKVLVRDNLFLEEFVEGIVSEYRVLFGGGEFHVFSRERVNIHKDFYQACGSSAGMHDPIEIDQSDFRWTEVKGFIEALPTRYGSLDVFFTEDKWGTFEFCNQYGTCGVKSSYAEKNNLSFIKEVVTNYLNGEIANAALLDRRRESGNN